MIVAGLLALAVIGLLALGRGFGTAGEAPEELIVAMPFDLEQIQSFSKYRSCEGHDYRAPTISGTTEATPRSMKHYVAVKPEFRGSTDKVVVYAPFDGKITKADREASQGSFSDTQVWLTPDNKNSADWQFVFFHIALSPGLNKGSKVVAGQRIGVANLARGPDGATDNFDIALKLFRPIGGPALAPPFNYASQEVLGELARYGVSASDFIISKEYRDANPCPVKATSRGPDVDFPQGAERGGILYLQNSKPTS